MTFDEHSAAIGRLETWAFAALYATLLQVAFGLVLMFVTLRPWGSLVAMLTALPMLVLERLLARRADWHLSQMRREVEALKEKAGEL